MIHEPKCEICGESVSHLKYKSVDRYPRTCSKICKGQLISKVRTRIINGEKASTVVAKKVAEIRHNKNNYFESAQKANKTKSESGIMFEAAQKRLKTQKFDNTFSQKIKDGMNKIGDDGLTAAQRGTKNAIKTQIANGRYTSPENRTAFENYKKEVWKYTNRQDLKSLHNFEKRGHISKNGWHLDHKISIFEGFKNNISAEEIGNISNLQMLPGLTNIKKGTR